MLKQDYKDVVTLEEAKALVVKILSKTLDTTKLSPEKRKSIIKKRIIMKIVHHEWNSWIFRTKIILTKHLYYYFLDFYNRSGNRYTNQSEGSHYNDYFETRRNPNAD